MTIQTIDDSINFNGSNSNTLEFGILPLSVSEFTAIWNASIQIWNELDAFSSFPSWLRTIAQEYAEFSSNIVDRPFLAGKYGMHDTIAGTHWQEQRPNYTVI